MTAVPDQRDHAPTDVSLGEVYRGLIGLNSTVSGLASELSAFITQSRNDNEARDARLAVQFVPRESIVLMAKDCSDDRTELKSALRTLAEDARKAEKERKSDRQKAVALVVAVVCSGIGEQIIVHLAK